MCDARYSRGCGGRWRRCGTAALAGTGVGAVNHRGTLRHRWGIDSSRRYDLVNAQIWAKSGSTSQCLAPVPVVVTGYFNAIHVDELRASSTRGQAASAIDAGGVTCWPAPIILSVSFRVRRLVRVRCRPTRPCRVVHNGLILERCTAPPVDLRQRFQWRPAHHRQLRKTSCWCECRPRAAPAPPRFCGGPGGQGKTRVRLQHIAALGWKTGSVGLTHEKRAAKPLLRCADL
jgi:hypothetical protein